MYKQLPYLHYLTGNHEFDIIRYCFYQSFLLSLLKILINKRIQITILDMHMSHMTKINMKYHLCYFLNDMIHIKNFHPNRTKIDKKSYNNFIMYYIGYIAIKIVTFTKINILESFYFVTSYVSKYIKKMQFHYV